jgi:hypothetical protein
MQVGSPNPLVSNSVALNVGGNPPVIETQPVGAGLYVGEALTMSVTVQAGTGVGALSYQWRRDVGAGYSDIVGATAATLNIGSVIIGDAGDYQCIVTDSDIPMAGVDISDPAALVVSAHVAISADPVGGTFNEGNVIPVLTLAAGGGKGPLSYQWAKDGVDIVGATAATLDLGTALVSESGSYTCTVTDGPAGTDVLTSAAAVIIVNGPLGIATQPVNGTVVEPAGHIFSVVAAGGVAPYTYQWIKDGVDIVGQTANTLTIDPTSEADEGDYRVRVVDAGVGPLQQMVTSNVATLTVNQVVPLTITQQPVSGLVNEGEDYTFTIAVSDGTAPYTYEWFVNTGAGFVAIPGSDNPVLALVDVTAANAGSYRCTITDSAAVPETVTTNIAVLQVGTSGPANPAVGLFGLGLMAGAFALGGALVIRRKK